MKKFTLWAVASVAYFSLAHTALAWDQPLWVRQLETNFPDYACCIATDGDGNVYIAVSPIGGLEPSVAVAKYSAAGALRWKRQIGYVPTGVATDGDGNVYVAGWWDGTWVAKYSAAGVLRWKRRLGTSDSSRATGVATDPNGNVYLAVSLWRQYGDFPYDALVAKYSTAGMLQWTQQLRTAEDDGTSGVATDADGNVYLAGSVVRPEPDYSDAWIAKMSATGALRWRRQLGSSATDYANGVATDGDGNVYVAGSTYGSLGGSNQGGTADAWLAGYSATGALRWKRQLGSSATDYANGVATDGDGNVYVVGSTEGLPGGPNMGSELWIATYSAAGAPQWKRQLASDAGFGVATYFGAVYVAGRTSLFGDALVAKYSTRP